MDKMRRLCTNEFHEKFIQWVKDYMIDWNVPDELFRKGVDRCSGFKVDTSKILVDRRSSRHKAIIENALAHKKKREAHYVVQKYLVRHPLTNWVISEVPFWSQRPRVGHLDIVGFVDGNPSLMFGDYKPKLLSNQGQGLGQLQLYQVMGAKLMEIPLREIGCMTFDKNAELILI